MMARSAVLCIACVLLPYWFEIPLFSLWAASASCWAARREHSGPLAAACANMQAGCLVHAHAGQGTSIHAAAA